VFNEFGVPELLHSDNGKQFVSKQFSEFLKEHGVKHIRTAVYSPQSNAAERVNQSVLNAIRAYLEDDHRDWDLYLSEIECALRGAVHQATGVSPYFALFGQNMITNGADYQLARSLNALEDNELYVLPRESRIALMREEIRKNLNKAYERSAAVYNRRSRNVRFAVGQEVYRKNFILSNFGQNYNQVKDREQHV